MLKKEKNYFTRHHYWRPQDLSLEWVSSSFKIFWGFAKITVWKIAFLMSLHINYTYKLLVVEDGLFKTVQGRDNSLQVRELIWNIILDTWLFYCPSSELQQRKVSRVFQNNHRNFDCDLYTTEIEGKPEKLFETCHDPNFGLLDAKIYLFSNSDLHATNQ